MWFEISLAVASSQAAALVAASGPTARPNAAAFSPSALLSLASSASTSATVAAPRSTSDRYSFNSQ